MNRRFEPQFTALFFYPTTKARNFCRAFVVGCGVARPGGIITRDALYPTTKARNVVIPTLPLPFAKLKGG